MRPSLTGTDRREFARAVVRWPATILIHQGEAYQQRIAAKVTDISPDGVGLVCDHNLPLAKCLITLEVPHGNARPTLIELPARVVYSVCQSHAWRAGLKLQNLSREVALLLIKQLPSGE